MQDGEEANLGAKMLGVSSDFDEGVGYCSKQQVVEFDFILPDKIGQFVRQTEHDMEVGSGQEFSLSGGDPSPSCLSLALWTMAVAARVKGDAPVLPTSKAPVDMTTKGSCAAVHDGSHHLELLETHSVAMTINEGFALSAKDIGHLHGGPTHSPFLGRRLGLAPRPETGRVSIGLFTPCK